MGQCATGKGSAGEDMEVSVFLSGRKSEAEWRTEECAADQSHGRKTGLKPEEEQRENIFCRLLSSDICPENPRPIPEVKTYG